MSYQLFDYPLETKALMETLAEALAPESNLLTPIAIEAIRLQSDYYTGLKAKEDEITRRLIMLCKKRWQKNNGSSD